MSRTFRLNRLIIRHSIMSRRKKVMLDSTRPLEVPRGMLHRDVSSRLSVSRELEPLHNKPTDSSTRLFLWPPLAGAHCCWMEGLDKFHGLTVDYNLSPYFYLFLYLFTENIFINFWGFHWSFCKRLPFSQKNTTTVLNWCLQMKTKDSFKALCPRSI